MGGGKTGGAKALYAAGRYEEAATLFAAQCVRAPGDADNWVGAGQSWLAAGKPTEAWEALTRARPLVSAGAAVGTVELLRAKAAAALGRKDTAEACYRAALAAEASSRAHAAFGTFLLNEGRLDEAEVQLRVASRGGGASDAQVLASLATLFTQSGRAGAAMEVLAGWKGPLNPPLALAFARACLALRSPAEALEPLRAALVVAAPAQRSLLHHAHALLLDQLDDIPAAAAAFSAMHAARGVSVDAAGILATAEAILAAYPVGASFPAAPRASGPRPLFIVGLPRSGTSLVEQGLAGHPDVLAAGERDELRRLTIRLGEAFKTPWPACAGQVHRAAAQGATMWRTAVAGTSTRLVVTEKLPDNLFRLGLAAQLFPDARAVVMQRDPMDTLLSCWQQAFGPAHAWTSTWDGLAAMAAANARLTARWIAAPPVPIHVLRYEDYVATPDEQLRALVVFAGLSAEQAMIPSEQVARTVKTASILQVRERVHTGSVGRWRRYAEVLEPLRQRLEAFGVR
ncbi:hypothetical protein LBMAG42_13760 [Deltaproteobacteria bacterium]|nr:hypothetical protein LBMAG42_13760 [Deltaproteobacteria bacterium]